MKTKIIYEDNEILVVYKPAGIATQAAGSFSMDVESELRNYLKNSKAELYVIHRLDQPVEGLLVFARSKAAAASLNKQLQNNLLNKSYLAVVFSGENTSTLKSNLNNSNSKITLTDYLKKDDKSKLSVVTSEKNSEGKKAILHYSIENIDSDLEIAILNVEIETGRFHQIRCQLSNAGLPLLGDQKYGNEKTNLLSKEKQIRFVALCANNLSFKHPKNGKVMEFSITPENKAFSLF